jgi:fibronectin type 3 domain-containing protein
LVARDIFPPDPPQGLQAVSAGAVENNSVAIDLSWSPSEESDVSGYNVYRGAGGQAAVRVNQELIKTPTYRDRVPIEQGVSYTYRVTAVDLRGNESKPSEPATETAR